MRGTLVVEDGTTAEGVVFGASKRVTGELVFNTNMTGYTEALTDPSYRGQILMMTYPLIGNYGVDPAAMESKEVQVTGFVVKEACPTPVHPKAAMDVDGFLNGQGRPGLSGVDTRMLTIKTRTRGTMRAALVPEGGDVEAAMREVQTMPFPDARNLVAEVSTRAAVEWPGPAKRTYVVIDCGTKMNIVREAQRLGRVVQLPYDATPEEVARHKPDGVIISNGPGDPAHPDVLASTVKTAKAIASEYPVLGICLGHQILALAFGGKTYKLKFGHRGGNQPVKDLRTGRVHITSQNHGFAVDAKSMEASEFTVTHVTLNDQTVEGMAHKELPVFSVQYHPEARPGPWDNEYIFQEFAAMAGR
jgi:carbamoyl-phosphate synthase small subunit